MCFEPTSVARKKRSFSVTIFFTKGQRAQHLRSLSRALSLSRSFANATFATPVIVCKQQVKDNTKQKKNKESAKSKEKEARRSSNSAQTYKK